MTLPSRASALLAVVLLVLFTGEVGYVLTLPLPDLVCAIPDDSFFFLRIAQEFWKCGEFSFDGVTQTYGFQPLWQLLMIALQPSCQDPLRFLQVALVLCCGLHVASGGVLWRIGDRLGGAWAGAAAAGMWLLNPAVMLWCWCLKENGLYALLWLLALANLQGQLRGEATRRQGMWLGVWLGLAVLTRVNAVSAAGVLLMLLVLAFRRGGGLRQRLLAALLAFGVALLLAAPWYLFAWWHFGTPMPTSGNWKMGQMRLAVEGAMKLKWLGLDHLQHALHGYPDYLRFLLGQGYGRFEAVLALLLPLGLFARLRGHRLGTGSVIVLLTAAGAAALSSFANQLCLELFVRYADWYAVTEFVLVPLLAGALLAPTMRLLPRWPHRLGLGVALATAAWLWPHPPGADARLQRDLLDQPPHVIQLLEMGNWLRHHLPQDTAVGIWDPGIVSYFRGGRCVSFDPLMNSLQYQQRFVADFWSFPARYVQEQQIAWMVGASQVGNQLVYPNLPPKAGSKEPPCEVVWLPYPDFDLGWTEKRWFQVVRPANAPVPPILRDDDFTFGVLYPNDPARRRVLTGDRDQLLAGLDWQADGVRLQLQLPEVGTAELRVDGEVRHRFTAADKGWQCRDARTWRGHRVQLLLTGADPTAVPQAQIVDCSLR